MNEPITSSKTSLVRNLMSKISGTGKIRMPPNSFLFKFNVWYRFAWQHRGSPHVHGLLWLHGAPDIEQHSHENSAANEVIVEYFDQLISAMHPTKRLPPSILKSVSATLLTS